MTDAPTPTITGDIEARITELNVLDKAASYRVIFACSEYGNFPTLEEAEKRLLELHFKSPGISGYVDEVSGWDDVLSEENMHDYKDEMMDIINILQSEHAALLAERDALRDIINKYGKSGKHISANVLAEMEKGPMHIDREWVKAEMRLLDRNCDYQLAALTPERTEG